MAGLRHKSESCQQSCWETTERAGFTVRPTTTACSQPLTLLPSAERRGNFNWGKRKFKFQFFPYPRVSSSSDSSQCDVSGAEGRASGQEQAAPRGGSHEGKVGPCRPLCLRAQAPLALLGRGARNAGAGPAGHTARGAETPWAAVGRCAAPRGRRGWFFLHSPPSPPVFHHTNNRTINLSLSVRSV